jgi:hypothetical protein
MAAPCQWPAAVPPSGTASWYVRSEALQHHRWRVRCHVDDRYPDGEVIAIDGAGRPRLSVNPTVSPGAPPMWFVHLDERDTDPQATLLVAFATDHLPAGTVVSDPVFFSMPVHNDEQVGAIRWWHGEAVVDQLYVRDDQRRLHVGTVLIYAASAFHQFNGWSGRLHSDGRRTQLGEALVTGLRHPDRIARLQKLMPQMDPGPADG